ncbi:MAG: DUF262 domain-containing protein [Thermus sp.]|nr:DUF262 domain-containing protein [Thermus sp.]
MQTGSLSIRQLLKKAKAGQFKLPQFQRDFVWNEAQVALLIDSIARNYPIGSLLLLEPSPDIQLSTRSLQAAIADSEHADSINNQNFELDNKDAPSNKDVTPEAQEFLILDGQQRLTSIVRVLLNANPSKTYWFDLGEIYESFHEERSDWIKQTKGKSEDTTQNNGRWIRADLILEGEEQQYVIKYFLKHLLEQEERAMQAIQKVHRVFETIRNYQVPYILLEGQEGVEAICRIFETINSTGTRLTTFDLAVARYFPYPDLRDLFDKARQSHPVLSEFDVDGERLLQVIVLLEKGREPSRSEQLGLSKSDIIKHWEAAVNALVKAITWARRECGLEPQFYVGESQLVALASVLAGLSEKKQENFLIQKHDQLVQWFFANVMQSGFRATNYRIFVHYQSLNSLQKSEYLPEEDIPLVKLDLETLVRLAKSDNRYKATLALLRRHIKSDFYSGATITSENFEMHHFFPRSFGARKKYIDSIANLVPVTKETNRFLSNRNPSEYIKDLVEKGNFSVQNERFAGALLPIRIGPQGDIKPSILSDDHYEVFVQERGKLILQKIKEVTGNRFADHLGEPYEEI